MSRRNKGQKSMNQDTDTNNSADGQEPEMKPSTSEVTGRGLTSLIQHTDESGYIEDAGETLVEKQEIAQDSEAETKQELVEATNSVVEEPVVTKAPQVFKQGTVVSGTTSALGKAVAKEAEKKILSQSSKMLPPTLTAFEQKVEAFVAKGSNEQKNIVSVLKRYIEEMPRGVEIKSETARLQQRALWNTILGIANKDEKFRDNWRMLISFFRNYSDGSLGDRSVNRYMDHLTNFKDEEKQAFLNILALISVTVSTPNAKDVHKYIVLDKVLVRPIKADARQRIINYYS